MSSKTKIKSPKSPSNNGVCHFEFQNSEASEVFIAGSFNEWHPGIAPMLAVGDGRWVKDLSLPPGRYEYRFVVDGLWVDDPKATETAPNPHGGVNAVVAFGGTDKSSQVNL